MILDKEIRMPEENWKVIDEVAGGILAEMLRGLLEAQGFQVWLCQEGAGRAYGLTLSTLGAVQILVPSESAESARHVLDDYYAGLYTKDEHQPGEPGSLSDQDKGRSPGDEKPDAGLPGQG
jgi:hypothetical protein